MGAAAGAEGRSVIGRFSGAVLGMGGSPPEMQAVAESDFDLDQTIDVP
jgi:hypothetical protein